MAVTTRGITAPREPAAKASSRTKASSKSKSANRTTTTSKSAQRTAPTSSDPADVPATQSPRTASPDLIEETDIEALNSSTTIRRLIQSEMAKARELQPNADHANTHRVRKKAFRIIDAIC